MRFVQLLAHEGAVYVDVSTVDAIGPALRHLDVVLRSVYLRGGQILVILDSPDNMSKLFEVKGRPS